MNEKAGYLSVIFRDGNQTLPASVTEQITDHIPSLIFVYNSENQRIQYTNRRAIDFTGVDLSQLTASDCSLETILHRDDVPAIEPLLTTTENGGNDSQKYFIARVI